MPMNYNKRKLTRGIKMKAILLMVGMFLMLLLSFVLIWFLSGTEERVEDAAGWLPGNSVEYAESHRDTIPAQWFI